MENPPPQPTDQPGTRPLRHYAALLRDLLPMVLIVVVVFAGVRVFFQPYQVVGASMSPALVDGERLFVNRTAYTHLELPAIGEVYPFNTPQRGDIVVLESAITGREGPYIKRIIALPGETITFTEGIVLIDGEPLVEDYIDGAITRCGVRPTCAMTVPDGFFYVLGDNRTDSEDSGRFGPVPMEDIVGRAYFSNWPYDGIGPISNPDYGDLSSDS
jgi:signal peptidase I